MSPSKLNPWFLLRKGATNWRASSVVAALVASLLATPYPLRWTAARGRLNPRLGLPNCEWWPHSHHSTSRTPAKMAAAAHRDDDMAPGSLLFLLTFNTYHMSDFAGLPALLQTHCHHLDFVQEVSPMPLCCPWRQRLATLPSSLPPPHHLSGPLLCWHVCRYRCRPSPLATPGATMGPLLHQSSSTFWWLRWCCQAVPCGHAARSPPFSAVACAAHTGL